MTPPPLDFGIFIAYLLPGVIAVYGLSLAVPRVRDLLRGDSSHLGLAGAVIVVIVALAAGRILSICRTATVDVTFGVAMPFSSCARYPFLGGIPSIAVDYRQLLDSGHREAFLLAVANEQRPNQFCGNTALAVALASICWLWSATKQTGVARKALLAGFAAALVIVLYLGARSSYYGYMRAMAAINGVGFTPVDRLGKPCPAR